MTQTPSEVLPAVPDDTTTPTPAPRPPSTAPIALFGTTEPVEVLERARVVAKALTEVLEERQLYKVIRGRKHIFIEGWLTLSGMLQIGTPNEWVRELTDGTGKRLGWEARYAATTADGRILSSAEGECRYAEENWEDRESHALRSMAQTRAQSKALASGLRWIVELGGFSGTPAEEMPAGNGNGKAEPSQFKCPECGKDTYDNREDNVDRKKAGKKPWPAFKCIDQKDCEWHTWEDHFFADVTGPAKRALISHIHDHMEEWINRFTDNESLASAVVDMVSQAIGDSDEGLMAGILWNEMVEIAGVSDSISVEQASQIGAATILVLNDNTITLVEAWVEAVDRISEARDKEAEPAEGVDTAPYS